MQKELNLFGKTFDQQLQVAGDEIADRDISPNRRIPGEIVFEPVLNGVRVTARDSEHRVLWGFIGSKDMISQVNCPVAVYETLQKLLGEELDRHGLRKLEAGDPMETAQRAVTSLQDTLDNLKASIKIKKASGVTLERAKEIARIASDANRMICLETSSFKGIK
jgi:hypothetical protein